MKHPLLLLVALLVTPLANAEADTAKSTSNLATNPATLSDPCQAKPIKANYEVSTFIKDRKVASYPFTFYRDAAHALYVYPNEGLADLWTLTQNNQLELSRNFSAAKRAIEYTSADLRNVRNRERWDKLFGVIDLQGESPISQQDADCKSIATYKDAHKSIRYYNRLKLPASMTFIEGNQRQTYTLKSWTYSHEIQHKLNMYRHYDAMDFADIGDNEADPFVSKMITMGFIEHSEQSHSGNQNHAH